VLTPIQGSFTWPTPRFWVCNIILLTTVLRKIYMNISKKKMPILDGVLKTSTISLHGLIIRGPVAWSYYLKVLLNIFTKGNTFAKY